MKVFICWSGRDSKAVAEELRQLMRKVFAGTKLAVEVSYDLDKGEVWLPRLIKKLERTQFGVLCLTPANMNSDWLLFEAGILSMATASGGRKRLCPYLLGVRPGDLPSPLNMFQTANADKAGTLELLDALVAAQFSGTRSRRKKLSKQERKIFDEHWPAVEQRLAELSASLEPRKIKVKRLELRELLTSHEESVIFRLQKCVRQAYASIRDGTYDPDNLFEEIALSIRRSQAFYKGIIGMRLGRDVAQFLEQNFNEEHLGPIFKYFEEKYLLPLQQRRGKQRPTECEFKRALAKLLNAIETATRREFLKLFVKLQDQEW